MLNLVRTPEEREALFRQINHLREELNEIEFEAADLRFGHLGEDDEEADAEADCLYALATEKAKEIDALMKRFPEVYYAEVPAHA